MCPTSSTTRPRWALRRPERDRVRELARTLDVSPLLATLLVNRDVADSEAARVFLTPQLERLHDPALLPGMAAATRRLQAALERDEMVLVHGDYDVDGVTGTALLVRMLEHLGGRVTWHVPNRFTDGYSFGDHSVARAKEVGASVVVSVDNGTSANKTIGDLAAAGVETIVTDHHEPPVGDLPPALAIVNPKLQGSDYPFRELCGAAVAFKLAWGLAQAVTGEPRVRPDLRDLLVDLMSYVAIATVCDVVPMVDENRVLASFGLKALEHSDSPGLAALRKTSGLVGRALSSEDVAFQIGPRINAAGRLGSAQTALEALMTGDPELGRARAQRLDELNKERRQIERKVLELAQAEARSFEDPVRWPVTVVAGQGWHQGVVGIVAARLVTALGKPAIVIGLDGETGRGSARSVPGFSILEALRGAAEHLGRHGGHEQAAGCELRAADVELVRDAVCARAQRMLAESPLPERVTAVDAQLDFEDMTTRLMGEVDRLEPFGERNPKPVLLSSDVRLAEHARCVGADGSHLSLRLRSGDHVLKAIGFGMGSRAQELDMGRPMSVLYTPRWNTFRGETSLEVVLADFHAGPHAGAPLT